MGKILFFGVIFLSNSVIALSPASVKLIELQKTFGNASEMHKIVYIDREIIRGELELAKYKEGQTQLRNQVVAEFVFKRIGVSIDDITASFQVV